MTVKKGDYWYGYPRIHGMDFAAVSGSSTTELSIFVAPFKCKIVKAYVVFDTAVTGAATNNFISQVKNKGSGGSGTSVICSETFENGVDAAQYDAVDLGVVSYNELQEGDTVTYAKAVNNSGMTMPAGTIYIMYVRVKDIA